MGTRFPEIQATPLAKGLVLASRIVLRSLYSEKIFCMVAILDYFCVINKMNEPENGF